MNKDRHVRRLHDTLDAIEDELMRFSLEEMQMILQALKTWEPQHQLDPLIRQEALSQYFRKSRTLTCG